MRLLLIRHCESKFNADRTLKTPDAGLTNVGRQQARLLRLPANISRVVCSPLSRCRDTVKLSGLGLVQDKDLVALCREHRTDACDFFAGEPQVAETEKAVVKRVDAFKDWLRQQHVQDPQPKDMVWAVVSHADFLFYFTASIADDGDFYGKWLSNGETQEWTLSV